MNPYQPQPDADGMVTLKGKGGGIGKYIGLLVLALFWNGITWSILIAATRAGDAGIGTYLFMSIFVLIGLLLLALGIGGLITGGMVRSKALPATVRVSHQPLRLGESFQVTFRQEYKSPVAVESVRITLKGLEWVEYRRGTTTYTDEHVFCETPADLVGATAAGPASPLSGECTFTIPADSMHSFKASDNQIRWSLDLRTAIEKWPDDKMSYPITVVPRLLPAAGDAA